MEYRKESEISMSLYVKVKMFVRSLREWNQVDVTESRIFRWGGKIADPKQKHLFNVILGSLFVPYTVLVHGIRLAYVIFAKGGLVIPHIEICLTTRCTLRCKYCANLMQYYAQPYDIPLSTVQMPIDNLCKIADEIIVFRVLGGEPFLYHDIVTVLRNLISDPKIRRIGIPTNGMIRIQNNELVDLLRNRKVSVDISDYGYGKVSENYEMLITRGIKAAYTKTKYWFDTGRIKKRGSRYKELSKQFSNCFLLCPSILNGRLYLCPRSSHGEDLGLIPKIETDSLDLTDEENLDKKTLALFYFRKEPISACDYCMVGTKASYVRTVPAGKEQIKLQKQREIT